MLANDGLGIACLQGGGPDALELGAVVGDIIRKERKNEAYHTMANEFHFNPIEQNLGGHFVDRVTESVYRLDGYFGQPFSDEGHKEDIKKWQLTGPNGVQLDQRYRCTVEEMREIILAERYGQ